MCAESDASITIDLDTEVVVLDVDDTLYLERDYVRSGFRHVGSLIDAEFGVVGSGDTLWSDFEQGIRGDAFDRALRSVGVEPTPELLARLVNAYRRHEPSIRLQPDAQRFLAALDGCRLGVITDGPPASQRAKLRALGLEGRSNIEIIVTGELGAAFAKPHSLPYELVETRLGVAPNRCWYLADNPAKDFHQPVHRGWRSVRVRRPDSLHVAAQGDSRVPEVAHLDEVHLGRTGPRTG